MYTPDYFSNWNGGGPLIMEPRGYDPSFVHAQRGFGFGAGIGGAFGDGRGMNGGAEAAARPQQTVNHSDGDLLALFKPIPDELTQAADDLESTDHIKRTVAETRVRGILSKVKFGLKLMGVEAIFDGSIERRGVSVSLTFTRAAVLDIAANIREALNGVDARGFHGGCTISISRSAVSLFRGLSGSCSIHF